MKLSRKSLWSLGSPAVACEYFEGLWHFISPSLNTLWSQQGCSAMCFQTASTENEGFKWEEEIEKWSLCGQYLIWKRHILIEVAVTLEMLHLDTVLTPFPRKSVVSTEDKQQRAARHRECLCSTELASCSHWQQKSGVTRSSPTSINSIWQCYQTDLGAALPPGFPRALSYGDTRCSQSRRGRAHSARSTWAPWEPSRASSCKAYPTGPARCITISWVSWEDNPATAVACQKHENWAWALPYQSPRETWDGRAATPQCASAGTQDLFAFFSSQVRWCSDHLRAAALPLNICTYRNTILAFSFIMLMNYHLVNKNAHISQALYVPGEGGLLPQGFSSHKPTLWCSLKTVTTTKKKSSQCL